MTISTILAVIDGGEGSEAALRTALLLGRDLGSRVDILHPRPQVGTTMPLVAEGIAGGRIAETVDAIEAAAEERAEVARALYKSHCVAAGLPLVGEGAGPTGFAVGFEEISGDEEGEVARIGRLSDLIVTSRPHESQNAPYVVLLETALFETGRPVVLAPPVPPDQVGRRIVVCWSDTRESARALAAGISLLRRADEVQVLSVRDGGCAADPAAVERYLARHGVAARSRLLEPDYREIGEQMLAEAAAAKADLLIAGGYGHSRLRELVLGGVTRSMIDSAKIPVLMAH